MWNSNLILPRAVAEAQVVLNFTFWGWLLVTRVSKGQIESKNIEDRAKLLINFESTKKTILPKLYKAEGLLDRLT